MLSMQLKPDLVQVKNAVDVRSSGSQCPLATEALEASL